MPVYVLRCPDCQHEFRSLVLAGTRSPEVWSCSKCGSSHAAPKADEPATEHPWERAAEKGHAYGCLCCGG
jgi:ribosomal protein L37AE/L43A